MQSTTTLNGMINAFIHCLQKTKDNELLMMAKAAFGCRNRGRPSGYEFKQQDNIAGWLEKPLQPSVLEELSGVIGSAIIESITRFRGDKRALQMLYKRFAAFLKAEYQMSLDLDHADEELPLNREATILKMLCDNKKIPEIAERLLTDERSIRRDIRRICDEGIEFMGRRVPISGADQKYGGVNFESTPHPILLLGNLMQVIALLESLRLYERHLYERQMNPSNVPGDMARTVWHQLSPYAQNLIVKRIHDVIYESDEKWYVNLERSVIPVTASLFQTEKQMTEQCVPDRILMAYKNGERCAIQFFDDEGLPQTLENVRVRQYTPAQITFISLQDTIRGASSRHIRNAIPDTENGREQAEITLRMDRIVSIELHTP